LNEVDKEMLAQAAQDLLIELREKEGVTPDADVLLHSPRMKNLLADALDRKIDSSRYLVIERWMLESSIMSDHVLMEKYVRFARLVRGDEIL
jgi:hypothetical protein